MYLVFFFSFFFFFSFSFSFLSLCFFFFTSFSYLILSFLLYFVFYCPLFTLSSPTYSRLSLGIPLTFSCSVISFKTFLYFSIFLLANSNDLTFPFFSYI